MDTPHLAPGKLYTGHFWSGTYYAVQRRRGTGDWLLIFTVSGAGRLGWQPAGELLTAAGDAVLIAPGTPHDYRTRPGASHWEMLWAHFLPRPEWREWLGWPPVAPGLFHLPLADQPEARETVARRLADAHRLNSGAFPRAEQLGMNALEESLLWCDAANPRAVQTRYDPRIRRALDVLSTRLEQPFHLPALAAQIGLSDSRFAHLFREQVGSTPGQFLEARRMDRARQLLRFTPATVAEVAAQVGFENAFYFSARFKRFTGVSPRAFRER